MKKQLVILIVLFSLCNIIMAQEVKWIVQNDTQLILYDNEGTTVDVKKNQEVGHFGWAHLEDETNLLHGIVYAHITGIIDVDSVLPKNSKELFSSELTNNNMTTLPYLNFDILYKKDRTLFKELFEHDFWLLSGEYNSESGDYYSEQESYEWFTRRSYKRGLALENAIVAVSTNNDYCSFFIENITKIKNGYECKGFLKRPHSNDTNLTNAFITTPTNGKHTLLILFDGDYINVYEDSKDKLLMTYAITDEKTHAEFKNLLKTGECDLSKVTWPRHADGSCDYDDEIKPPRFNFADIKITPAQLLEPSNVALKKIMTVSENLKLRAGEDISTQVLAVMQAGSRVQVFEVGKAETIDGISSNWVRVVVLSRSKNRDGKPIREGTVGWCFGGDLE